MKLENRTILITGVTSGIGLGLAKALLARRNTVVVTGRDAAKLEQVARENPGLHTIQSDVADPAAIQALHAQVLGRFPSLDTLFNNAGIMRNIDLAASNDLVDLTREIETNLTGPIRMAQQFLPHLSSRPGSLIVNVSSGLAFVPLVVAPLYCATKAAIHSYSQSLREQLRGKVVVIELAPPGVETPLFRGEFEKETKGQKPMSVEALVKHAIEGIEADKPLISPGLANVLRTMGRIAPDFMFKQLAKMAKPN